jgi:hypothetical protein
MYEFIFKASVKDKTNQTVPYLIYTLKDKIKAGTKEAAYSKFRKKQSEKGFVIHKIISCYK